MTSKQDIRAEEVLRRLRSAARIPGIAVADAGGVYLLVRARIQVGTSYAAAHRLFREELGRIDELAAALSAAEIAALDAGAIGKWTYDIGQLDNRRDIDALIAAGARALRRYRGRDLGAELAAHRERLARYRMLPPAHAAAVACLSPDAGVPSVEQLVDSLPLRLFALADWQIDPVERLVVRDVAAGFALVTAARTRGRTLAALAAVLLGIRHRTTSPDDRGRRRASLPPWLRPVFDRAVARRPDSPVLLARAAAAGRAVPSIAHVPPTERERLCATAERVAIVAGLDAALDALDHLAHPYLPEQRRRAERHLFRFARVCAGRVHNVPSERDLAHRLVCLPDDPDERARFLANELLDWVAEHARNDVMSRDSLAAIAVEIGVAGGVEHAAAIMCREWSIVARKTADRERPTTGTQVARVAMSMAHPASNLRLPRITGRDELVRMTELVVSQPAARIEVLFPHIAREVRRHGCKWAMGELVRGNAPAPLVARALAAGLAESADVFASSPRKLKAYVECVEQLLRVPGARAWVMKPWFARIFSMGRTWSSAMVLTLVARTKGASRKLDPAALFGVSAALEQNTELAAAIDDWSTIRVDAPPAELPRLSALLGVSPAALNEYLHFRRAAGHGEVFSAAVLAPLKSERKIAGQIEHLERVVASDEHGPDDRERLAQRLAQLRDPARRARRIDNDVRLARNTLLRSRDEYRAASLEVALDTACARAVSRVIGRHIEPPLPAGLRDAFHLLHAQEIALPLLRSFLTDVLHGRSLVDREPNQTWLTRAGANGIDTDAWLRGVSFVAPIDGANVYFTTERDPLHLLKMGSYFGTCLSLDDGFNAASTLVNALDVNKHVIYGRREDGTVVARKLIGARATGELAGYCTYGTDGGEDYKPHLDAAIARFAERCGLHLSDSAVPETLHDGFWYDDGNEHWGGVATSELPSPPADLPPHAASEWHLRTARIAGDGERIEAVARSGIGPARVAAIYRLFVDHPERAATLGDALGAHDAMARAGRLLTAAGNNDWLRVGKQLGVDVGMALATAMPADAAGAARCARAMRQVSPLFDNQPCEELSYELAGAPSGVAIEALARVWAEIDDYHGGSARYRVPYYAWFPVLLYARASDRRGLCRELVREERIARLVVAAADVIVMPELASWLRRRLARARRDVAERTALALGNIRDPADGPRIVEVLRRWPSSIDLAVAVVRTGDPDSVAVARALWDAPDDMVNSCSDVAFRRRLRELGPPDVGRRLRRRIMRALADGDGDAASSALELLGQLSIPGYRFDDLADALPDRYTEDLRRASRRCPLILPIAAAVDRRRHVDAIVDGTVEERSAAVEALLTQSMTAHRARAVRMLVGDRAVSNDARAAVAVALNSRTDWGKELSPDQTVAIVDWMRRGRVDQRAAEIVACARRGELANAAGSLLAVLQVDDDPELAERMVTAYYKKVAASPGRIMSALNAALYWLHPQVAEPLVEAVLSELPSYVLANAFEQIDDAYYEEEISYRLVEIGRRLADAE